MRRGFGLTWAEVGFDQLARVLVMDAIWRQTRDELDRTTARIEQV
jgi:hypothetical protein